VRSLVSAVLTRVGGFALALYLAELFGIGYFQFYYASQPVSCTVDDKRASCFRSRSPTIRAHEFHMGNMPDGERIRVAHRVLKDRIASFKAMDEKRDILYNIADKRGRYAPSACRTTSQPSSARIPEPVPYYQRIGGSRILCRSLPARETQVAILLLVLNNALQFQMLNIRH
jgi:hypothetical protein